MQKVDMSAPATPSPDAAQNFAILQRLYDALTQQQFANMAELKPFADVLQKLARSETLRQDLRSNALMEQCMKRVVQISEGFKHQPLDDLRPNTIALVSQLEKIATVLGAAAFRNLPEDRKNKLFAMATATLESVSAALEGAPARDREALVSRSQVVIEAMQPWQEGEEEEEEEMEDEDHTGAKIDMLLRLTDLVNHPAFDSMEVDEQREIVERLDAVLGMLSAEEGAAHQSAIEAALITIRRVTSVSQ